LEEKRVSRPPAPMMILVEGITASRDWRLGVYPALPAQIIYSRIIEPDQWVS
jgi:hypothetical protein